MNAWQDKPDADGLWWRQTEMNMSLVVVDCGLYAFATINGQPIVRCRQEYSINNEPAKWQRCDITKPEPYVAPKPPKVRFYTAKSHYGERFIVRIGETHALATAHSGVVSGCWELWEQVETNYTDIQPCEPANT